MPIETTGAPETDDERNYKNVGGALAVMGAILTVFIVTAPIGIPLLLAGIYIWWKHR